MHSRELASRPQRLISGRKLSILRHLTTRFSVPLSSIVHFLYWPNSLSYPWLICIHLLQRKKHRAFERTVPWWKWSSACDGHCFGPILRVWGVFAARNPESPVTHQQVSSTNLIGLSSFPKSLKSYKTFPELGLWQSLGKLASTLSHWLWGRLANVTIFVILMQLHSPLSLGLHYSLLPYCYRTWVRSLPALVCQ